MFTFSKEELSELLSKVFDEGCGGYQDLKEGFLAKILEDLEKTQAKVESTIVQATGRVRAEDWRPDGWSEDMNGRYEDNFSRYIDVNVPVRTISDQAAWDDLIARTLRQTIIDTPASPSIPDFPLDHFRVTQPSEYQFRVTV